jgi:DNA-binding response OmpR family regulator
MVQWSSSWRPSGDPPPYASVFLRVLVVGNERLANLLCNGLCIAGLDGFTAHSGLSGLLTAEKRRPEIVLIDLALPDMDGIDLANAIRSTEDLEETVLIALSSDTKEEAHWESRGMVIDRYLVKPIVVPKLAEVIQATWRVTQQNRRRQRMVSPGSWFTADRP